MTSSYPVVPAPDGLPAFDYRAPSPLLQRGIDRLATLTEVRDSPLRFLWIYEPPERIGIYSVQIAGDVVLLGMDKGIMDRGIVGVDRLSGGIRWSIEDGSFKIEDSLPATDTTFILAPTNKAVSAFDTMSGELLWSFDAGRSGGLRFDVPIQIHHNFVGIATDLAFHVLDFSSGEETCSYWCRHQSSPTLDELFYTIDHNKYVIALNPRTDQVVWEATINHAWMALHKGMRRAPRRINLLHVHNGIVLLTSGTVLPEEIEWPELDGDHAVRAYDALTGECLWHAEVTGRPYLLRSPIVTDDMAYVSARRDRVSALDLWTGEKRWSIQTDDEWSSITALGDIVYFDDNDNRLTALDASTGTERWTFQSPYATPHVEPAVGDLVYINTDSALFALDATDGSEQWRLTFECPEFGADGIIVELNDTNDTAYIASAADSYYHKHDDETYCDVSTVYAVEVSTGRLKWQIDGFYDGLISIHTTGSYVCIATRTMTVALEERALEPSRTPNTTARFSIFGEYAQGTRKQLVKEGYLHFQETIFLMSR